MAGLAGMRPANRSPHGRPEGFTLVEILIVAAIVGILVAIAIPGLLSSKIQANEVAVLKGLRDPLTQPRHR